MSSWRSRIVGLEQHKPSEIADHPQQWRTHPEAQRAALLAQIGEIGVTRPLIIFYSEELGRDATTDGHLRKSLRQDFDWPCLRLDVNDDEARQDLLFGDPLAAMAGADADVLADLLAQIETDDAALQAVLDGLAEEYGILGDEPPDDPGAQVDKAAELQEKWGTALGQVWEIGEHRLVCGDCTDPQVVAAVMQGERASLFATDPPYGANAGNIGFTAQRDDIEAITKDDLEGVEMQAFLETVFAAWLPYLKDDCAWYLWHPMLTQGYFAAAAAAAAAAADLIIHRQIIWCKEQFIYGRGDYHWRHELCFYGWRQGHRPPFYGPRNQDTVWDIPWGEKRSEIGHPTAKPPRLFTIPMQNHLRHGDICAEPFAGSGSQIVAAEQFGACCLASEIDPGYCAVALERLQGMGLTPRLAGTVGG